MVGVMTKEAIIADIESRTSSKYGSWRIGLTNDPDRRRQDCERDGEKTDFWMDWRIDSLDDAREIEQRFTNRGMKPMTVGQMQSRKDAFVFIF